MNIKFLGVFIIGLLIGMGIGTWVASPLTTVEVPEDSAWRTESIRAIGSTTVLPIANAAAIAFMQKYPGVDIRVEGGGSGHGYASLIDGACDIAMASRKPKLKEIADAKERNVSLILHEIAVDAVVIIVNPSVSTVPLNLTLEQVAKIFNGTYTKWSEVDPSLPDEKIIVFTREAGSGTRGTFEEHVMEPFGLTITPDAQEVPSNPAMRESVRNTQYSIGYVGLGFVTEDVVTVNLAVSENETYYEPTPENIYAGKYPISRYLYLVTNGWPESGSLVDRFIDFIRSPEGQRIVEDQGFLALPKYPPST